MHSRLTHAKHHQQTWAATSTPVFWYAQCIHYVRCAARSVSGMSHGDLMKCCSAH
jgi:hypothetical protein